MYFWYDRFHKFALKYALMVLFGRLKNHEDFHKYEKYFSHFKRSELFVDTF